MKNLTISLLAGLASFVLSASAFAISITYDYVGEPLQAVDYAKNPTSAVSGASRVLASVTLKGSIAQSIIAATGDLLISNSYPSYTLNDFSAPQALDPEVSWSITDGVNSLTQNTATNFLLQIGFKDGVLTSGLLFANYKASVPANPSYADYLTYNNLATPGDFSIFATSNSEVFTGTFKLTDEITGYTTGLFGGRSGLPIYKSLEMNDFKAGKLTMRVDNINTIPVPAALPLLASALGLFGIMRRRLILA